MSWSSSAPARSSVHQDAPRFVVIGAVPVLTAVLLFISVLRHTGRPPVGSPSMATAVFFHAHPDDEAIATGGTMAKMASKRATGSILVTATRGELGEVPDGMLGAGETTRRRARPRARRGEP